MCMRSHCTRRSLASSCGRDAWSGGRSKALQQRVELLEAENETLQKQVVSDVNGEDTEYDACRGLCMKQQVL